MPGLLLVAEPLAGGSGAVRPTLKAIPLSRKPTVLGRGRSADVPLDDERLSRAHARVAYHGGCFWIADESSKNGTFVDGAELASELSLEAPRCLRIGYTVFAFERDIRPWLPSARVVNQDGFIAGARLQRVWEDVGRAAKTGDTVFFSGESGSGKEICARVFHANTAHADGPFVAVNCASIPAALAERLLFGARRGAYSGAEMDTEGFMQAADRGTLFLDEIGELALEVQAKLLRAVETHEITPLGATRARAVDVRICSATQRSLSQAVAEGKFRDDLYYRLGAPEFSVPSLRDRPDEVPWLLEQAVGAAAAPERLALHASLVEAALRRPWPGNVRELCAEAKRAAHKAIQAGQAVVGSEHLEERAGTRLKLDAEGAQESKATLDDDAIRSALAAESGNVSAAARRLGMHRTQLRRWLEKQGASDPH